MENKKGQVLIHIDYVMVAVIAIATIIILTETPLLDKVFPTKDYSYAYRVQVDSLKFELAAKTDSIKVLKNIKEK